MMSSDIKYQQPAFFCASRGSQVGWAVKLAVLGGMWPGTQRFAVELSTDGGDDD